jgi:hypothetical protein
MFKMIQLITLNDKADDAARVELGDQLLAATEEQPGLVRSRLAPTGAFIANGGDLHWLVEFRDEHAYLHWWRGPAGRAACQVLTAGPVSHIDSVAYHQGTTMLAEPAIRGGIHRTLLLAIRPMIALERIQAFEAEMREMARYVPAIRNWTHVWEQDFHDEAGLNGPYMMHPIHFASIDRWFDCQSHEWIVDNQLCHSYCSAPHSMIAPAPL